MEPGERYRLLLEIQLAGALVKWLHARHREAVADRDRLIREALAAGVSGTDVAREAGISAERALQIRDGRHR